MQTPPQEPPLSIPTTALAGAAVGLVELAWRHHTDGPFETGSVWAGALVVALIYGLLGGIAAVKARVFARLGGLAWIGLRSATLPLALSAPVAAHLLGAQLGHWSSPPMRAVELAMIAALLWIGIAAAARVLRAAPLVASPGFWAPVALIAGLFVGFQPQVSRGSGAKPEVSQRRSGPSALLVTIDTLRADGVGAYGHPAASTPTLDGLAADGVLFETTISHSVLTGPSHMSILSGLLPMQHGVIENSRPLPHDVPTLAETLSAEGWETAAFVSGYPVTERASRLLERFDSWDDDMRAERGLPRLIWTLSVARLARRLMEPFGIEPLPKWRKAERVSDAAVEWLESDDAPFFAWVHYYDPHLPYEAPEQYIPGEAARFEGPRGEDWYHLDADARREVIEDPEAVARMRQLYDAEITLVDTELARVIAAARERAGGELWIAVTSDHGESFGEHGIWYRRELYDASLRVPLILATPASGPKGVRVREQARLTDLAPTLLDALGLSWRFEGEGVSLLPLARGEKSPIPGPSISAIYSSHADPYQRFLLAVRNDRWKSIWRSPGWANSDALFAAETRELYDLEADPGELNNQSSAQPDLWQGLRDMAGEVQMDMRSDASLSPAELDVLRQLGYTN